MSSPTGWEPFYGVHGRDAGRLLGYRRDAGDVDLCALLGTKTGAWFWTHSDEDDIHTAVDAVDAMEKADFWLASREVDG